MKDWHKLILVYLAGRKTRASPENMKKYLKKHRISKSHSAITTACQKTLSDILFCHDQSTRDDDDVVIRKRFQYSLKNGLSSINALTKAFDHDRDSQTMFMRSQYYQGMIHDLVKQFVDSIPDNDLWKLDTHERTATRDQPLSDEDERLLTGALRANWLALKFVTHFISVEDDDERSGILQQLLESAYNPKISPTAAHRRGYKIGFCSGMDECIPWINEKVITKITINEKGINEKVQLSYASARRQADLGIYEHRPATDKLCINWTELFAQLHHLNSNYTYLFD